MAEFGYMVGWGSAKAGREVAVGRVFDEAMAYWNGLQASGEIESFEVVMLGAHGGDLQGFALLRGDREKLVLLRMTADFVRIIARAETCLDNVGVVEAYVDGGARRLMETWESAIVDLV
jgi:hypothetical protein